MRYGGLEGEYGGFGKLIASPTLTGLTNVGGSSDLYLSRYAAKQLLISGDGTGATTNAGWILGNHSNGASGIWASTVTPVTTNYALAADATSTYLQGGKMVLAATAGNGPAIAAGIAATDVNALSITQTWNNGAVAFRGIRQVITNTASAAGSADLSLERSTGQGIQFFTLSELTTIAAAATTDTTIQMPANSVIFGVSVRVTTVIPTATTFTVGDSGSAARFSTAAVSVAATSTDPGTKAGAYYNASALSIRITPNGTPGDNTGRVRVTIHGYVVTPPTS